MLISCFTCAPLRHGKFVHTIQTTANIMPFREVRLALVVRSAPRFQAKCKLHGRRARLLSYMIGVRA